jgi:hypothetical protein
MSFAALAHLIIIIIIISDVTEIARSGREY